MLKSIFIIISLLFTTNVALANPVKESPNLNVTSLDDILHMDKRFTTTSTAWSPDGKYLLVTSSRMISPSNSVHKHYLLDTDSHTFGEINYGIKELSSYSIPEAKWSPSGDKIYFRVSKFAGPNDSGNCFIVCNPDGTNLRGAGTNFTDLSNVIVNIGSIGNQNNLKWSPDSSKIMFEWQKPGNFYTGIYIANGNGTNLSQLSSATHPQTSWSDFNKVITATDEGTVSIVSDNGDLIQKFQPDSKNEQYCAFSLSPDRKKILLVSGSPGSFDHKTYISNVDGSKCKGMVSYYDGDNPDDSFILTKEFWQPDGSLLLVNQNGSLYIVEGDNNNKRLLYKGNASKPQWFPDGNKILFIENKNKLYSIDVNGTNLTYVTNFGLVSSYFWDLFSGPFNKAKQFSISPSGDIIVFTSALYPDTGKIIENEPEPSTRQNVAAPLFIVSSDGSNLTQVTPTIKGKYDMFREWSPNGKQFTVESVKFSRTKTLDGGGISLVETDVPNSAPVWKYVPVSEIITSKEPNDAAKTQNKAYSSKNITNATKQKEKREQFPHFTFLLI